MDQEQVSPFAGDSEEVIEEPENQEEIDDGEEIIDEEEPEEGDEEEFDEDEEEELDDEEDELSDEEIDELLDDPVDTVPHAALHKERERRKATQAELLEQKSLLDQSTRSMSEYKEVLDDIERQLKEYDLDDTIKIRRPHEATDAELKAQQQLETQKQQEQLGTLVGDMREEAAAHLEEFPQLNGEDSEQAELIIGFALANTLIGGNMEDSVIKAMSILNSNIVSAKKSVKRPVRRVKSKTPTQRKRTASTTGSQIKKGNVRGIFDSYAEDIIS